MTEIRIKLAVSGVTKVEVPEPDLAIYGYYNSEIVDFHYHHTIVLQYNFDLNPITINFFNINSNDTDYSITITPTPNSRKSVIIIGIDPSLTGNDRFFAECISGDSILGGGGLNPEQITEINNILNPIITQIYNDLAIDAQKIVAQSINPNSSASSVLLTQDRTKFFVQTNTIDYDINSIVADWDYSKGDTTSSTTTTGLNMPDLTAGTQLQGVQYNTLYDDYPRPTYTLVPFHDLSVQNLTCYAMRNFEGLWLNSGTRNALSSYQRRFGIILDNTNLSSEYVRVEIQNLVAIVGSPLATSTTFPLTAGLATSGTGRPTIKNIRSAFRIFVNSPDTNSSDGARTIFALPLTTNEVQSNKTISALSRLDFWINKQGWYFGTREEANLLYTPITRSYAVSTDTLKTISINLEDGFTGTIYPVSFVNDDPTSTSTSISANNFARINIDPTSLSGFTGQIEFTLRIITATRFAGSTITIYRSNPTSMLKYTYTIQQTDIFQPDFVDLLIRATATDISVVPVVRIENQNYYDWAFNPAIPELDPKVIQKSPAQVLTTNQYNSFNPDRPIVVNITGVAGSPIILNNLRFYNLRDYFGTSSYTTIAYQNRVNLNVNLNALNTTWIPLTFNSLYNKSSTPVANNRMFPASTSSTANLPILKIFRSPSKFSLTGGNTTLTSFELPRYSDDSNGDVRGFFGSGASISGKLWVRKNSSGALEMYQGSQNESNDIVYWNSGDTSYPNFFNKAIDVNDADKIFYPRRSDTYYDWASRINSRLPYEAPKGISSTLFYSATPRDFTFKVRLYCTYGLSNFTDPNTNPPGTYRETYTFSGSSGYYYIKDNVSILLYTQRSPGGSLFGKSYSVPASQLYFYMNQPKVVDLVFRVVDNTYTFEGAVDKIL
jgi:hypothetical protein